MAQRPQRPLLHFLTTDGEEYFAFCGPEYVFNNLYPASFISEGHFFNCSMQYYQWQQAKYVGDLDKAARTLECRTPRELTLLGPTINYAGKDWNSVRKIAMFLANLNKFLANEDLAYLLLYTGNIPIVMAEDGDEFWTIGLPIHAEIEDKSKWNGQNEMGDVLRMVRNEIEMMYQG